MRRWLVCSVVAASTLTASASFAQVLGDTSGFGVSALAGYATKDMNFGVGARLGYTLPVLPVYVGGTFVYHFGTSESAVLAGSSIETSTKQYYYGVEAGYSLGLGLVALRPFVGIGASTLKGSATACTLGVCSGTVDVSSSNFAIWPGLDILLPVGPVFVGADARLLHAGDINAFAAYATVGLKF